MGDILKDSPMNLNAGVVGEPSMFEGMLDIAGALNERYGFANVVEYEMEMTKEDMEAERADEAVSTGAEEERPLAERLEKFLQLLWCRYDTTGDGVISETDIFRYHKEGKAGTKMRAR